MRPYRTYSKEVKEELDKAEAKWLEEHKELSTDLSNNNESTGVSTSYDVGNNFPFELVPNRKNRRKEMKRHTSNPHELNIGRINPMYTKEEKDFCQKQKKKQFNDFIKGKVK